MYVAPGGVAADTGTVDTVATSEFRATRLAVPGVATTVGYRSTGLPQGTHLGLPSPYLTFIFSLEGPVETTFDPDRGADDRQATTILLSGLHTSPAFVVQPERQSGIQLAINPLASRALFGVPAGELPLVGEGEDVLGSAAERLRQRLMQELPWEQGFAEVGRYLRRRLEDSRTPPPRAELVAGWTWIARHRGSGSMEGLSRHVHLGPRQLSTLFDREFGVSPKRLSRLMRFHNAKRRVVATTHGSGESVADIAADCGYADHSHLVREFREFTSLSPTGWLEHERRNVQAETYPYPED
ncbi:helix-turn-helix domain-containing protein [Ornithinicoccus hortensis]|uniref:AraC family transcriptional regulator n=1 Tax=Ornithinicoccus hortensis TaxID=82346 RepID=A0A542YQP4_9MICO|nr:AraC family transcriptional regulator [Ornithinicoccus hortensis]